MRIRLVVLLLLAAAARADYREFKEFPVDPSIETKLRHVADATVKEFPKLKPEDLSMTVIDMTTMSTISRGDYRGDAAFYPASVVKLFFMAEAFHQKVQSQPDMPRALGEMMRISDNDAAAFIMDVISDTAAGPELDGRALKKFIDKRSVINRWLTPLGYDISAMAKPWSFSPYGREMQLLGANRENRNRATTNAIASLMLWIVRGRAVSPEASKAMMELLARPLDPPRSDENQVKEFIGESLPKGSKLWSKAGWTSEVRHDAAYVELPSGRKYIVVIFTRGVADDVKLVPSIAAKIFAEME